MNVIFLPILPAAEMFLGITRSLQSYYSLFAILMLAIAVNIFLLVWHRKKNNPKN
jgi:hypothetical protein